MSGHFDAVTAYSVFTHLTEQAQVAWLAEIHRILAPGGVFAASIHGPSAAWFDFGLRPAEFLPNGINDTTRETQDVAGAPDADGRLWPAGAYRNTYQTPEHTRRVFGRFFDVLEYVERGIGNSQDLVVLRKRS